MLVYKKNKVINEPGMIRGGNFERIVNILIIQPRCSVFTIIYNTLAKKQSNLAKKLLITFILYTILSLLETALILLIITFALFTSIFKNNFILATCNKMCWSLNIDPSFINTNKRIIYDGTLRTNPPKQALIDWLATSKFTLLIKDNKFDKLYQAQKELLKYKKYWQEDIKTITPNTNIAITHKFVFIQSNNDKLLELVRTHKQVPGNIAVIDDNKETHTFAWAKVDDNAVRAAAKYYLPKTLVEKVYLRAKIQLYLNPAVTAFITDENNKSSLKPLNQETVIQSDAASLEVLYSTVEALSKAHNISTQEIHWVIQWIMQYDIENNIQFLKDIVEQLSDKT